MLTLPTLTPVTRPASLTVAIVSSAETNVTPVSAVTICTVSSTITSYLAASTTICCFACGLTNVTEPSA